MVRPEKVQAVADIKQRLEDAYAVFFTEFAGLSVPEQQELRRGLREGGAEYRVLKLTLTRLAVDELGMADALDELLTGPTALAFTAGDPVPPAKVLHGFAKEHEALLIKGLLMSGELLPPEKVSELAALVPHDVMLSHTAGLFQAPMAKLAGLLAAFAGDAASLFGQLLEQKEGADKATGAGETPDESAEAGDDDAEAGPGGADAAATDADNQDDSGKPTDDAAENDDEPADASAAKEE